MRAPEGREAEEWLVGGGEVADLLRSTDWSESPLGPRERWPPPLRWTVNLLLGSKFPAALLWGRERLLLYNDSFRDLAGEAHPRALGRAPSEVPALAAACAGAHLAPVLERGESLSLEDQAFPVRRGDRREEGLFTVCASPVRLEDGSVGGALLLFQERTALVSRGRRVERERERALEVFEQGEACFVLDREFRILLVNAQQERLSGKPREETLGRVFWDVWPETAHPGSRYWREYRRAMRDRVAVEFEDYSEPLDLWTDVRAYPTKEGGLAVFFHDATRRKRTEQALGRESELLTRLIERLPAMVTIYDPARRTFRFNAEFHRVLGWTEEDAAATDLMALAYPDPAVRAGAAEYMASLAPAWREFPVTAKDGRVVPSSWANLRLSDDTRVGIGIDLRERREEEEALRRGAAMLRGVLDAVDESILLLSPEGVALLGNETAVARLGGDARKLLGRSLTDALPPALARSRLARVREVVQTGRPVAFEDERDGLLLEHRFYPVFRADGSVESVATFSRDATSRRQAEEALRRSEESFRQLANAMPQLVWSARPDGAVDYVNERAGEFQGIERSPAGAWTWEPILHPEDERGSREAWARALRTGEPVEIAHRMRRRDGRYRWYLTRALPMRDAAGRVTRWFGTATDIHEQKQAEEALREADRRKDEFLAMLSHELRNPLAPIRNSLYILGRAPPGGPQAQRAKEVIDRQVGHVTRLVDDLLDVTRISRGKIRLQRERHELCGLVFRAAEDHRSVFLESGIDLEVQGCTAPVWAQVDPTRLSQAIGNLLGNAAKFTPRGGRVSLSFGVERGLASIRVRDTGAGLAPETVGKLFTPFVQAQQTIERSKGGLGLGLALVKGLVELHGGSVSAHSEGLGRGAEFVLRLPIETTSAAEGSSRSAAADAAERGRRILIVEDNVDAAETLREVLELDLHTVEMAATGPEGVEKAKAFAPDVILCDIGLPGLDGYGVARAVRADPRLQATCLIAISGYSRPEDVERSREAGFNRHLAKPLNFAALEQVLASVPNC